MIRTVSKIPEKTQISTVSNVQYNKSARMLEIVLKYLENYTKHKNNNIFL